jgi:hypothetical protein
MNDVILFVARRLVTKAFWALVATSFLGIMMWELRGSFKDRIFQEAVESLKAGHWKDFRGGKW